MEKADLLKKIIEAVGTSFELNYVLNVICKELLIVFGADRVAIACYPNREGYYGWSGLSECKVNTDMQSLSDCNFSKEFQVYLEEYILEKGQDMVIDNISESSQPDFFKKEHKNFGTKSIINIPIKKGKDKWGILGIFQHNYYRQWTAEEVELLHNVVDYVYVAIRQAELYSAMQKQAERENLLRHVIETIRNSLDIDETLTIICDEVAKLFKVERATIVECPDKTNFKKWLVRKEFRSRKNIKVLNDIAYDKRAGEYNGKKILEEGNNLIIDNMDKSNTPAYYKKSYKLLGVKSALSVPIKSEEDKFGIIYLSEVDNYRHWTEDEIKLLQTIADQIYISIKQAELYSITKKQAERESILRQIMLSSVSSLNLTDVLKTIVYETGKLLKADRCFFVEYDSNQNEFLQVKEYGEYTASPDIMSITNRQYTKEEVEIFAKHAMQKKQILVANNIDKIDLPDITKCMLINDYQVKSYIIIPVLYRENPVGGLVLHYIKDYKQFNKDEIDLLSTIANQSAIVLNQAKLFNEIQESNNRETLLKSIINEILTSSNIETAYLKIATKLAEVFHVDRSTLRLYDPILGIFSNVVAEYRQSEKIPSIKVSKDISTKDIIKLLNEELVEKQRILIIGNSSDEVYSESLKESFKDLNIKTSVWVPIIFQDKLIATIFLTNTEFYKAWSKPEINLLTSVAQQITLGINLFKLADEANRSLNTERALREIIIILRQSESHDQLFNYLLENITKIFKVDRAMHLHYLDTGDVSIINEYIKEDRFKPLKNENIFNKQNAKELKISNLNRILIINDINKDIQDIELKNYLLLNEIMSFVIYTTGNIFHEKSEEPLAATMICLKTPRIWISNEIETFKLVVDTATFVYQEIKQRTKAEELKQTFLATLTHDLRSPIIGEQKALEAIVSCKLGVSLCDFSEYLQDIYKTNEELLWIVNNILSVYHYESGKVELKLERTNVAKIIDDSTKSLLHLAKDQGSQIITNIQPDIPLAIIDRDEILRVITNLLSNAIKHNKKGTSICISALKIDNVIQVSVQDNGKGISEHEKPNIFQRYPTTKRKIGTGLGLYLSKQIIDAHHEKIWFETWKKKGTIFYFTLPISDNT